jgi:hypothetical protein
MAAVIDREVIADEVRENLRVQVMHLPIWRLGVAPLLSRQEVLDLLGGESDG